MSPLITLAQDAYVTLPGEASECLSLAEPSSSIGNKKLGQNIGGDINDRDEYLYFASAQPQEINQEDSCKRISPACDDNLRWGQFSSLL